MSTFSQLFGVENFDDYTVEALEKVFQLVPPEFILDRRVQIATIVIIKPDSRSCETIYILDDIPDLQPQIDFLRNRGLIPIVCVSKECYYGSRIDSTSEYYIVATSQSQLEEDIKNSL